MKPLPRIAWAFAAGMILAIAVGYAVLRPDVDTAREGAPEPVARKVAPAPPAPRAEAPASPDANPRVEPSRSIELDRSKFPASGSVRVSLGLVGLSADDRARPVRVISQPDHRIVETSGALDSERTAATIELAPEYLQPGTYLVEMKTTERGPLALRRYYLVVR